MSKFFTIQITHKQDKYSWTIKFYTKTAKQSLDYVKLTWNSVLWELKVV
jgi:hypothetical protein